MGVGQLLQSADGKLAEWVQAFKRHGGGGLRDVLGK